MEIYNQFISTKLQEFMEAEDKKNNHERKAKDSFWATESETPVFDLYHKWIGTPPTNPIDAEKLVMFSAGKMMEEALVQSLAKMGALKEEDLGIIKNTLRKFGLVKPKQEHFRMTRMSVPVSGYMDAIFVDGTPCEIKTFYGDYQARELEAGKPRTSYLKQLAIYMDALDKDRGKLIYMDRGTGKMYEFTLVREPGTLEFKCINIEFDLNDTYIGWAQLYTDHIEKKLPPKPDKVYKYPIETMDWSKISNSQISKARNNHAVIGDWEVKYSAYKDLYLELENTLPGYTDDEILQIKEATKGYTSKK